MDNKQFLTVDEQIKHLKNKGISFENYSEEKAKQYLRYNNNLFNMP